MFAMITPALISGALVGRMKFTSWCIFVFAWSTLIYDPLAHWVWSLTLDTDYSTVKCLGWLCSLGAIDFAGKWYIYIIIMLRI
jgi:Amt family ammonium transporter